MNWMREVEIFKPNFKATLFKKARVLPQSLRTTRLSNLGVVSNRLFHLVDCLYNRKFMPMGKSNEKNQ